MKAKEIVLVLAVFCNCSSLFAQKKEWKFGSQNYAGITEGESGTGLQLQTINGFRYKTWFTGVGTGIDYYFQRSIPLFLSVSKFLAPGKLPLYFVENRGQLDDRVAYYVQGRDTSVYFTGQGLTFAMPAAGNGRHCGLCPRCRSHRVYGARVI